MRSGPASRESSSTPAQRGPSGLGSSALPPSLPFADQVFSGVALTMTCGGDGAGRSCPWATILLRIFMSGRMAIAKHASTYALDPAAANISGDEAATGGDSPCAQDSPCPHSGSLPA